MPAINLTIRQQGTKTDLNDRTILDQRLRLKAPKTGNKTGVRAKQTNKQNPHYIKIWIYLCLSAEGCHRQRVQRAASL